MIYYTVQAPDNVQVACHQFLYPLPATFCRKTSFDLRICPQTFGHIYLIAWQRAIGVHRDVCLPSHE